MRSATCGVSNCAEWGRTITVCVTIRVPDPLIPRVQGNRRFHLRSSGDRSSGLHLCWFSKTRLLVWVVGRMLPAAVRSALSARAVSTSHGECQSYKQQQQQQQWCGAGQYVDEYGGPVISVIPQTPGDTQRHRSIADRYLSTNHTDSVGGDHPKTHIWNQQPQFAKSSQVASVKRTSIAEVYTIYT